MTACITQSYQLNHGIYDKDLVLQATLSLSGVERTEHAMCASQTWDRRNVARAEFAIGKIQRTEKTMRKVVPEGENCQVGGRRQQGRILRLFCQETFAEQICLVAHTHCACMLTCCTPDSSPESLA